MTARIRAALRAIARSALPEVPLHGIYEYRVVTVDGGLLNLQATVDGLPDLARVEVRPGIGGSTTTPALGSLVLVAFVNADAARPVVVSFDSTTPTTAALDATSVRLGASHAAVVRVGDTITGTVTAGAPGSVVITSVSRADLAPPTRVLA